MKPGIDEHWVAERLQFAAAEGGDLLELWGEVISAIAEGRCENVRKCCQLLSEERP